MLNWWWLVSKARRPSAPGLTRSQEDCDEQHSGLDPAGARRQGVRTASADRRRAVEGLRTAADPDGAGAGGCPLQRGRGEDAPRRVQGQDVTVPHLDEIVAAATAEIA